MKFFASIARAFMEARQREAERIVRDRAYFKAYDAVMVENLNVVKLEPRRTADSPASVRLELAA